MIETKRLTIEPMSNAELEELQRSFADTVPELSAAYQEMLDGCRNHPQERNWYTSWKMCKKDTGEKVGDAGFKGVPQAGLVEIGYGVDPAYQNQGYATEGAQALVEWALQQTGVHGVEAEAEESNQPSLRVLEKLGFKRTGVMGEEGPRFCMLKERKVHPVYLFALLYVFAVYFVPVFVSRMYNPDRPSVISPSYFLLAPVVLGTINFIYIKSNLDSIGRERLLKCTVLIKYLLIPFYIVGGLVIAVFILLTFTPLVFMGFFTPILVTILSVLGWLFMIGSAPFSLMYIFESKKAGVHGKVLCFIAAFLQFFFTVDVISIMVLTLKEKKCVKATIATIVILLTGILISIIGLICGIASAVK